MSYLILETNSSYTACVFMEYIQIEIRKKYTHTHIFYINTNIVLVHLQIFVINRFDSTTLNVSDI